MRAQQLLVFMLLLLDLYCLAFHVLPWQWTGYEWSTFLSRCFSGQNRHHHHHRHHNDSFLRMISAIKIELEHSPRIKEAAQANGLKPVPEFVYLQYAIAAKDNEQKAVKRLEKMQKLRDEYGATSAQEDGSMSLSRELFKLLQSFLGSIGRDIDSFLYQTR